MNLNLDVSYAATEMVHLAGGAEWRDEHFTIRAGEPLSWQVGPYAAQDFVSGSNGFAGFPDYTAGTGPAPTPPSTATSSCGNPTTGGLSAARCGSSPRRVRRDRQRQAVPPLPARRRRLGGSGNMKRDPVAT